MAVPAGGYAWQGAGALALQLEMACGLCPPVSCAQQNAMGLNVPCGESKTPRCFTGKLALRPSLSVVLKSATGKLASSINQLIGERSGLGGRS